MQQARSSGGAQEVAATQGVKLTGSILGTAGVTSQQLQNSEGNFVARSQRETMPGQQNASGVGVSMQQNTLKTPPLGGLGNGIGGGLGGLAKLPKLEL